MAIAAERISPQKGGSPAPALRPSNGPTKRYDQGRKAMTMYSLDIRNESTNTFDFCAYQTSPDIGVPDVFSLAWFTKRAHPSTSLTFTWSTDYSFVWDTTGELVPGVIFKASQVWPADPSKTSENAAGYDYTDGAYTFAKETGAEPGHLYVMEGTNIPDRHSSVGVGMSGQGTFAVQAQPNLNLVFTPHPRYWIAAGRFFEGEVLDQETITNPAEIDFPANVYTMLAILHADNTWTVEPSTS